MGEEDFRGDPPLCQAARSNHEAVISALLEAGASPNCTVKYPWGSNRAKPVIFTAKTLHLVRLYCTKGANINARDQFMQTPLMIAVKRKKRDIVQYLLDHGADINAMGKQGRTALIIACKNKSKKIVRILLERGSGVDAVSPKGPALVAAAGRGYYKIVELLLEYGADINMKGSTGGTALEFLEWRRRKGFFKSPERYLRTLSLLGTKWLLAMRPPLKGCTVGDQIPLKVNDDHEAGLPTSNFHTAERQKTPNLSRGRIDELKNATEGGEGRDMTSPRRFKNKTPPSALEDFENSAKRTRIDLD
jgi:hypothetical protein